MTKFYGYKEASAEFSKVMQKTTYDPLQKSICLQINNEIKFF